MSSISPVAGRNVPIDSQTVAGERPAEPVAAPPKPLSRTDAEQTVKTLNQVLNPLDLGVIFNYDDSHHTYGFKIVDQVTKEVIREFPTPGVLEAARDAVQGMLIDQRG